MSETQTRVQIHPDFDNADWQLAVSRIEDYVASEDAQSLHNGRNSIKKMTINGVDVAIKFFRNKGFGKKLAYKYRSSKARRSYEHTQRLLDVGLHSPQAIGWREDWHGAWLHQSYYLCRYHEVAFTAWDLKTDSLPMNTHWVSELGRHIARMHEAGIHHQDLTPGNALFMKSKNQTALSKDEDAFSIYFIDNNRMSFGTIGKNIGLRALVTMGLEGAHIDPYATAYAQERGYDVEWACAKYRQLLARHHFKWKVKNKTRPWRRKLGL